TSLCVCKLLLDMWPTLVANKIFKKRLGSSNFIADIPSRKEPLLGILDFDHNSKSIHNDHKGTQKCMVFVSTWNVGGIAPEEDLNIDDLLETCNEACDIYILGFQEIVPLKASNVLGSENNDISMKWNSIIREALNKKSHKGNKDQTDGENLQNNSLNEKENSAKFCEAPHDVQCIISKQMVGIFISVWTRRDLYPFIRHPSVSCVGCGIMGCLGNKGSVSVRFQLHETSFCFVCSHLASGGREGDEKYRNSNVTEIFSRTIFPRGPLFDLPRTILDHECDRIVWHGEGLKQVQYTRTESKLSDHRPVKALFTAEVTVLPKLMKNLQSLFLSERFDQIKTPFEVSTTDDFVRTKRSSFRL
ncbi:hypothetical protein V8G54_002015, partial [Vigna mungo]